MRFEHWSSVTKAGDIRQEISIMEGLIFKALPLLFLLFLASPVLSALSPWRNIFSVGNWGLWNGKFGEYWRPREIPEIGHPCQKGCQGITASVLPAMLIYFIN